MAILKEVCIEKFRDIKDLILPIGERLTIIAGRNGTSKTTILGMLAHGFTFDAEHKTLFGSAFHTDLKEVLQLSDEEIQSTKININLHSKERPFIQLIPTYHKEEDRHRIVARGKAEDSEGKLKAISSKHSCPVIYLTLGRLSPLFELTSADPDHSFQEESLSEDELKIGQHLHKALINIDEELISFERLTSKIKTKSGKNTRKIAAGTKKYGKYGMSAGQDTIVQIAFAILSFKRLKEKTQDYKGGLLLIDEVEATLHPSAQRSLIQILNQYSREYSMQIVLTTHSWSFLQDSRKEKSQINYITKDEGEFKLLTDMQGIEEDFFSRAFDQRKSKIQIPGFCEDKSAKKFLELILSKENKEQIHLGVLGTRDVIVQLAKNFFKCKLNPCVWFLDGDQLRSKNLEKGVLVLPSNRQVCPELEIYEFLVGLESSDSLWQLISYTKSQMFHKSNSEPLKSRPENKAKRLWEDISNTSRKVNIRL